MDWSFMDNIVLWSGHFLIGLAYYVNFYLLKSKEEIDKETKEVLEKNPHFAEVMPLVNNKFFILVIYLIVGYFNLFLTIKKLYNILIKKTK